MPRLLADIISAIVTSQTDFELVGDVMGTAGLTLAASQAAADILIRSGRLQRRQALRLLWRSPRMKIVTIDPDGQGGVLYELRLDRSVLKDISPIALVAAIRRAETYDRKAGR
jgi:DNA-binding NarL/FixJ family response regulator